ncbi:unnamed protein product [Echinostoma caproni]|uniref:Ribosomal protein S11 n=1 Tax=Echinostoma caproni TaxID=27848 RepID=A0A183BCC8_9TREM|nr:unnamed protein product [Echinostoma caproni]
MTSACYLEGSHILACACNRALNQGFSIDDNAFPRLVLGHNIVTEECLTSIVGDKAYYELPILHILAKRNNIMATLTDCNGRVLTKSSCGAEGFQNARKKTTVAAQTLGISMGLKAQKLGINTVRVKLRGIGANRISTLSGATLSGLRLVSLTDDTNMHYGHGKRPRKVPRK